MKDKIANIVAGIWFFGVLIETILLLIFCNLAIFFGDIIGMLSSGFPTSTIGMILLFCVAFIFGITGLVPVFRRCYFKLPWLYPLCMILTMHLTILAIAELILEKGFEVISTPRHITAIVIMIIQVIVCRVIMCIYLHKKPLVARGHIYG